LSAGFIPREMIRMRCQDSRGTSAPNANRVE
jgi:hypothetical protein